MNKLQLITHISVETGLPLRQVRSMMDHLLEAVTQTLQQGDSLSLKNFGTFQPIRKEARPGRNPKTNEPALISARTVVKFKMGAKLHQSLNG